MEKIAVIIPCYNESKTIAKVVHDFKNALPEAIIYVYDNNSTDGSDKIALEAGAVVRYEYMQGKGYVVRKMFNEINAKCYLMIDGDDTYPAENAREMVDIVLSGKANMVIGDRLSSTYFIENKRPFHNLGNNTVRWLINKLFKNDIRDIMTGYRAFDYIFVKTFPVISRGFEIETEMTIHALDKKLALRNVVVRYRDRPKGSFSKLNTYSDGIKVLLTIVNLFKNYKPLSFFGFVSILMGLASIGLFIPVLIDYINTGLVLKFPTLFVSGFLAIAAVVLIVSGLLLDVIIHGRRQDFEIKKNEINFFQTILQKSYDNNSDFLR